MAAAQSPTFPFNSFGNMANMATVSPVMSTSHRDGLGSTSHRDGLFATPCPSTGIILQSTSHRDGLASTSHRDGLGLEAVTLLWGKTMGTTPAPLGSVMAAVQRLVTFSTLPDETQEAKEELAAYQPTNSSKVPDLANAD